MLIYLKATQLDSGWSTDNFRFFRIKAKRLSDFCSTIVDEVKTYGGDDKSEVYIWNWYWDNSARITTIDGVQYKVFISYKDRL